VKKLLAFLLVLIPGIALAQIGGSISSGGTGGLSVAPLTNSMGGNQALNTSTFADGPSVAQGTVGTWCAMGTVTMTDTASVNPVQLKLWDGTTVIASGVVAIPAANDQTMVAMSGCITNPAGNIRISGKSSTTSTSSFLFNNSGLSKDSTITVFRIQ
jgi:hypothetical protein